MKMQEHMAYGGIASIGAWFFWGPWNAIIFWLASVLIDFDHYIDHVLRTGGSDWNVKNIFRLDAYMRPKLIRGELQKTLFCISIFHTIEVFSMIYFLGVWTGNPFFHIVLSGMLFHMFLDLIFQFQHHAPFVRAYSFVEYVIRRRLMRSRGVDPDAAYSDAYRALGIDVKTFGSGWIKPLPE